MKFEPNIKSLHQGNAYWMAVLSHLVYIKDEAEIKKRIGKMGHGDGLKNLHFFNDNASQGFLLEHEKYLAMVFRGTDEAEDWLNNFDIAKIKTPLGKFHNGFYCATHDIWQDMFSAYKDANTKKPRPLFITGHSLGGAMATIAAAHLATKKIPFTAYTFGQPRAVHRKTARHFQHDNFFRFTNNKDIVPRVPFPIFNFRHIGQLIHIDKNGKLHHQPNYASRIKEGAKGIITAIPKWIKMILRLPASIADHERRHYIRHIRNSTDFPANQ